MKNLSLAMLALLLGAMICVVGNAQEIQRPLTKAEIDEIMKGLSRDMPKKHLDVIQRYLENLRVDRDNKADAVLQQLMRMSRRPQPMDHGLPSVDRSDVRIYNRLGARLDCPSETMLIDLGVPEGVGQVLLEVAPSTFAAQAGFKAQDLLVEFAGKDVSSDVSAFAKALHEIKKGMPVEAVVVRNGETLKIGPIVFRD